MDDNKGLSAVLVHSPKGQRLFERISKDMILKQIQISEITRGNPALSHSCSKPESRNCFMSQMDELTIDELARNYIRKQSNTALLINGIKAFIPRTTKKLMLQLKRKI